MIKYYVGFDKLVITLEVYMEENIKDVPKKYKEAWEDFLCELNENDEFDRELKKYLNAIKYISEINIDSIDNDKDSIFKNLEILGEFINKFKTDYYEIGMIRGFANNIDEIKKLDGRDYYYFMADKKMKASVYYMRYLNFIYRTWSLEEQKIDEIKDKIIVNAL